MFLTKTWHEFCSRNLICLETSFPYYKSHMTRAVNQISKQNFFVNMQTIFDNFCCQLLPLISLWTSNYQITMNLCRLLAHLILIITWLKHNYDEHFPETILSLLSISAHMLFQPLKSTWILKFISKVFLLSSFFWLVLRFFTHSSRRLQCFGTSLSSSVTGRHTSDRSLSSLVTVRLEWTVPVRHVWTVGLHDTSDAIVVSTPAMRLCYCHLNHTAVSNIHNEFAGYSVLRHRTFIYRARLFSLNFL